MHAEIDQVPADRRAALLKIIHAYREAVDDEIDPAESIRRGLADIRECRVHPVETLWGGLEET
ncbi:MAG: hypothetical protein L0H54_14215 [Alcaligenaceae bacterium]|nr:hypothetical protein [Alcaligenaceae bacterium]